MDKSGIFLYTTILMTSLLQDGALATRITKENIEFIIETDKKYPTKIFKAKEFLDEIRKNLEEIAEKRFVELDVSKDESLISDDIIRIYRMLKKEKIKIKTLNVSSTGIDREALPVLTKLLRDPDFKCLDISGTQVAEIQMDTSNPKIIFVPKELMEAVDTKLKVKELFGEEVFNRHLNYYSVDKTFSSAWGDEKFQGINLRRVMYLGPDTDGQLNEEMQNDLLNSKTLSNLRKLSFRNQNINDDLIARLCSNESFPRIVNIDLSGNKDITVKSLKAILESQYLGSIRDFQQISCRYNMPASEISLDIKNTSITAEDVENFKVPRDNFCIRYFHPADDRQTFPTDTNAIKILQFR